MATVHPRKTSLHELTAGEIMQSSVITVGKHAPIQEVERVLSDHRISGCPVIDEKGHVVGVISMRDLVERYAKGEDRPSARGFYDAPTWDADEEYGRPSVAGSSEEVAADLMNAEVFAVDRLATVPDIARVMVSREVHRVLVKDRGNHIGLLTTMDILRAVATL